ncbi:ABC-type amino acid transport system, permease [Onion yellows phytoplasma OY-M]|uniref:ABC-type amino acid transport system, permease n=1 Tax=Onion yellows phytoplasma (strain OY-M) TaxID=262768 RepID=Q6YQ81_ONYPE|nr:ABC-type amino acid transport system, permease [Onion yellows phytoplasma OY-M]
MLEFIILIWLFKKTSLSFLATPFITTLLVISLNTIANLTNLFMHNIKMLDKGQIEAAYSLGMNQKQVFKYILFEQGLQRTKPFILATIYSKY